MLNRNNFLSVSFSYPAHSCLPLGDRFKLENHCSPDKCNWLLQNILTTLSIKCYQYSCIYKVDLSQLLPLNSIIIIKNRNIKHTKNTVFNKGCNALPSQLKLVSTLWSEKRTNSGIFHWQLMLKHGVQYMCRGQIGSTEKHMASWGERGNTWERKGRVRNAN